MYNRTQIVIAVMLSISLVISPQLQAQDNPMDKTAQQVRDRILQKALQYTGFDSLEGYSNEIVDGPELVRHETDNTPFLHRYFAKGEVWLVTFNNIVVASDEAKVDATHEHARNFYVYLDAESERLLKIQSTIPTVRWPYRPAGTLEERQAEWSKVGIEAMSMPEELPVPLIEILAMCPHQPHLATEIVALYVTVSTKRPVRNPTRWEVYLWGISPLPSFGPGAEEIPPEVHRSTIFFADPVTGEPCSSISPAK